jgi:hypothetical protein
MRSRYRCSMCPAIHINSRSWLRSSSTHEPSDPPLRVVISLSCLVQSSKRAVDLRNSAGRHRNDTDRVVDAIRLRNVVVNTPWFELTIVCMGDRYGDSLNLAAMTELYPADSSRPR